MKQNKMERLLPREQRPYEKCEEKGAKALTNKKGIGSGTGRAGTS